MDEKQKLENRKLFLLRVTRLWPTMTSIERQVLRGATMGVKVFSVDELTAITHCTLECDEKLAVANALLESIEVKQNATNGNQEIQELLNFINIEISFIDFKSIDMVFSIRISETRTIGQLRAILPPNYGSSRYTFTSQSGFVYLEDKTLKEQRINDGDTIYARWWPQVNGV